MSRKNKNKYRKNITPPKTEASNAASSVAIDNDEYKSFDGDAVLRLIKQCGFWKSEENGIVTCAFPDKETGKPKERKITTDAAIAKMRSDVEMISRTSTCVEELIDSVMDKHGCLYVPTPDYENYDSNGEFPEIPIVSGNVSVVAVEAAENNGSAGKGVEYEISCLFRCYDNFGDKPVRSMISDGFLIRFNLNGKHTFSYASITHNEDDSEVAVDEREKDEWKNNVTGLQELFGGDKENVTYLNEIITMLSRSPNSKLYGYIQQRAKEIHTAYPQEAQLRLKRGMQIAVFTNNIYLNRATKETCNYILKGADCAEEIKLTNDFSKFHEPKWAHVRIVPDKSGRGIEVVEEYEENISALAKDEMLLGDAKFCFAHINGQKEPVLSIYDENNTDTDKYNGFDAVKIKYEKGGMIVDDFGVRNCVKEIVFYDGKTGKAEEGHYALKSQCTDEPIVYQDGNGTIKEGGHALNAQVHDVTYEKSGSFRNRKGFMSQTVKVWHDNKEVNGFASQSIGNVWYDAESNYVRGRCFSSETVDIIRSADWIKDDISEKGYKPDTKKLIVDTGMYYKKSNCLKYDKEVEAPIIFEERNGFFSVNEYWGFNSQIRGIWFIKDNKFVKAYAMNRQTIEDIAFNTIEGGVGFGRGFARQTKPVKYFDDDFKEFSDINAYYCCTAIEAYYMDENGKKAVGEFLSNQVDEVPFINENWCKSNLTKESADVVVSENNVEKRFVLDSVEYRENYQKHCDFCGKTIYADEYSLNNIKQYVCSDCIKRIPPIGKTYSADGAAIINDDGKKYVEINVGATKHTVFCNHVGCTHAAYADCNDFVVCKNCGTAFCDDHRNDFEIVEKKYCNKCAEVGTVDRGSSLFGKIKRNINFFDRNKTMRYFWDKLKNELTVSVGKGSYKFLVSGEYERLDDNDIILYG